MNKRFIYVFSSDDRDKLLSYGFDLIKSDERQQVFIFANRSDFKFSIDIIANTTLVFSDVLTF